MPSLAREKYRENAPIDRERNYNVLYQCFYYANIDSTMFDPAMERLVNVCAVTRAPVKRALSHCEDDFRERANGARRDFRFTSKMRPVSSFCLLIIGVVVCHLLQCL